MNLAVTAAAAGEGCTLQATPGVEVVFERPEEVEEYDKKVGG